MPTKKTKPNTRKDAPKQPAETSLVLIDGGDNVTTIDGSPIQLEEESDVLAAVKVGPDVVVGSLVTFRETRGRDIRRFYLDEPADEWRPTTRGVRINAELVVLATFALHLLHGLPKADESIGEDDA